MSQTLDKTEVATIRAEIDQALAAVAVKHGMKFSLGRIVFTSTQMRGKLQGDKLAAVSTVVSNATGVASTVGVSSATLSALKRFNIDPNKKYQTAAGVVKFVDYVPRRYKFPFSVEVVGSGKRFKLSEMHARFATEVK